MATKAPLVKAPGLHLLEDTALYLKSLLVPPSLKFHSLITI